MVASAPDTQLFLAIQINSFQFVEFRVARALIEKFSRNEKEKEKRKKKKDQSNDRRISLYDRRFKSRDFKEIYSICVEVGADSPITNDERDKVKRKKKNEASEEIINFISGRTAGVRNPRDSLGVTFVSGAGALSSLKVRARGTENKARGDVEPGTFKHAFYTGAPCAPHSLLSSPLSVVTQPAPRGFRDEFSLPATAEASVQRSSRIVLPT